MWRTRALAGASILGLIVLSPSPSTKAGEEQGAQERPPEPPGDATAADFYAYIPPYDRGKPKVRVSGATRGPGSPPGLEALIPENHIGITTRSHPTLYWYLTRDTSIRIDFSIGGRTDPDTQIKRLRGPFKAGIQRIRLSDYDIELKEGVQYRWSVALIPNPKKRSHDVVCSGLLQYQEPSEELSKALAAADAARRPGIYAQRGVWYEAFGLLSDQIAASPDSAFLRDQRAKLIDQIGFPKIAASERAAP